MLKAIGDLHLSMYGGKEMDVFGGEWTGYAEKIRSGFSALCDDDTVVLCGDTSWGLNLAQSLPDFIFLEQLPGKKILLKGNHDYFWDTTTKMTRFFEENGLEKLSILHNNAYETEKYIVCGTRGWFYEEQGGTKVFNRELIRLNASLEYGKKLSAEKELLVFLHYPPVYEYYTCDEVIAILLKHGVSRCFYGHLHGSSRKRAFEGEYKGIDFKLISADHINFIPVCCN